jgi:hypothetical protein
MKLSLSLDQTVADRMQEVAKLAGTSASSVAEIALKRFFAFGTKEENAMTVIAEGGTPRRHTRKTWINAFYKRLHELVPEQHRTGGSGYEFLGYDVMASGERADAPEKIVIHLMEANLPTSGETTYHGTRFTATVDSAPAAMAEYAHEWLKRSAFFNRANQ